MFSTILAFSAGESGDAGASVDNHGLLGRRCAEVHAHVVVSQVDVSEKFGDVDGLSLVDDVLADGETEQGKDENIHYASLKSMII